MAVSAEQRIRWAFFQAMLSDWLRKIFWTPNARARRYRETVAAEAFETWMNWGSSFETHITHLIAEAEADGASNRALFWLDVLEAAKQFDADPENRRKRDEMTSYDTDVTEAAA